MTAIDIDVIAPEAIAGVRVMPILHERVDLAPVVRQVLEELRPEAVAVELPTTLADAAAAAVARLPKVSAVISEERGEDALVWVVTPGDPLVEGMRWAIECGREVLLVDPDIRYGHRRHDQLPDPHSLHEIGVEKYLDLIRRLAGAAPHDERDTLRERGMAFHLQQAAGRVDGSILCLVGAAHADRVARYLDRAIFRRRPTSRPPWRRASSCRTES
jgi:pheromone shutdown protein TraB